jgi:hypothetical protein
LSVETSTTVWSAVTASPTATRHSTTTPSVTDSMSGRTMSTVPPAGAAGASGAADPPSDAAGASGSGAGASAAGASGPSPLPPPPPVRSSARSAPTATLSPGLATILVTSPLAGEGTSTSTLSVVTSRRVSPARTSSPSVTRHSTTTPSVTDSPSSGSTTWTVCEDVVDTTAP